MFRYLFMFEMRLQLTSPFFWLAFVAFAAVGVDLGLSDPIRLNMAYGENYRNAAAPVLITLGGLSINAVLVAALLVGKALLRDGDARTTDLIRMTKVPQSAYVFSQVTAGYILTLLLFLATVVAMAVGFKMPWLPSTSVGPTPWAGFAIGIGALMAPNILFGVAVMVLCMAYTRSIKYCIVGAIGLVVLHSVANAVINGNAMLEAMTDPFGGRVMMQMIQRWTTTEINTRLPIDETFWLNRFMWSLISVGMLVYAVRRFRLGTESGRSEPKIRQEKPAPNEGTFKINASPRNGVFAETKKAWSLACREFKESALGVPFLMCVLMLATTIVLYLLFSQSIEGTPVYPVTHLVLGTIDLAINVPAMLIAGFYAGELVHRERDIRLSAIVDTYPVSAIAWLAGKGASLMALLAVLAVVCSLTGICFQLATGFTAIEPWVYVLGSLVIFQPICLFAITALGIQLVCSNKYFGYLLTVVLASIPFLLQSLGVHDHLLLFNTSSPPRYSDMNGFGHFLGALEWYDAYWALGILAFLQIAFCCRARGIDFRAESRRIASALKLARPTLIIGIAVCLSGMMGVGGWIFHNTHQINQIDSARETLAGQARYERLYRHYIDAPQPRMTVVDLTVNMYPSNRLIDFHGIYSLVNMTQQPITTLLVTTDRRTTTSIAIDGATTTIDDTAAGFAAYQLKNPLQPGQKMLLPFSTTYSHQGFTNDGNDTDLVTNGTFVDNSLLPSVGYDHKREIPSEQSRQLLGLGHRVQATDQENPYVSVNAGRVSFHAIVSTEADQIPLAPGALVHAAVLNGRSTREYVSEKPMADVYGFMSAHWTVTKARWNSVSIEVYSDSKHPWNVDHIVNALKDGLDTYSRDYGPYGLSEIRVAEFPGYRVFAQSYGGMIAYSEALGFTSKIDGGDGIDFPYFITAHELAHQWWGHQLVPADVPGATLLTESMAQLSAIRLTSLHKNTSLDTLLNYERASYQDGLKKLSVPEQKLTQVTDQAFVSYHKGDLALVDYAETVGWPRAEEVFRTYFDAYREATSPYPLASDFVDRLRATNPPSSGDRFNAWFEGDGLPNYSELPK